jgi:ATP-dependent Clp protease, protease subunit
MNDTNIVYLINYVENLIVKGYKDITINIRTNGGSLQSGIAVYNYLSSLPSSITIRTHNMGTIDSAGIYLYCAGNVRTASKNSRFLVHNGTSTFPSVYTPESMSEAQRTWAADLKIGRDIFSNCTGLNEQKVISIFNAGTVYSPSEAKEIGLVHKITSTSPTFTEVPNSVAN